MKRIVMKKRCDNPGNIAALAAAAGNFDNRNGKFEAGEYRLVIERVDHERTTDQNRFYWSILAEIEEYTGQEAEDLHRHFRARFLQDRSVTPARIRSTTELSVGEFIRYIDQITRFAAEQLHIVLQGQREF